MDNTDLKLTPVDIKSRKALDFKAGDTVKVWSKIQEKGKSIPLIPVYVSIQ